MSATLRAAGGTDEREEPPAADDRSVAPVAGRALLLAVGISIAIAVPLGLLTWFGLPLLAPGLSSIDWLATIIATEVYLSFVVGHLIAFGGLAGVRRTLGLGPTSWRDLGLALAVWVGVWLVAIAAYAALSPGWPLMREIGQAVLKVGSLYGRLENAGPALTVLAIAQPVLVTPLAEELLFRGSLYGWLRGKLPAALAILVSSVAFALYHPLPLVYPLVLLFGLGAGWVRERTGSLTPFVVMHVLNSVWMIALAYAVTGWRV